MALKIALSAEQTQQGVECPDAYFRIAAVTLDYVSGKMQVAVNAYATESAARGGKSPVSGFVVTGEPGVVATAEKPNLMENLDLDAVDSVGVRASTYTWLKTLPVLAEASDVLEAKEEGGSLELVQP